MKYALFVTAALVCAGVALAQEELQRVPGTHVSLAPPEGFRPAREYPGFEQRETASSIMVTEIPGPFERVLAGLTEEGLAQRGMQLLEAGPETIGGRDALLLRVAQQVDGARFAKWIAAFGEGDASVMVLATHPSQMPELSLPMKQAVLSTQWAPDLVLDPFDGLRFRVEESEDLKVAGRMSNMLLIARPGKETVNPTDPLVVVGPSIADADLSDLDAFARKRLRQTAQITDAEEIETSAAVVDGLNAIELTARAREAGSGTRLHVYQMLIADGPRYYLLQGLVGVRDAERFGPQFREIARSFRRDPE